MANKNNNGFIWLIIIGVLVFGMVMRGGKDDSPSTNSSPSPTPITGKPSDMPQEQWDYLNKRLKKEFPNESQRDIEKASKAIWDFDKAKRARGEQ